MNSILKRFVLSGLFLSAPFCMNAGATASGAGSRIDCHVEVPCAWTNPIPGENGPRLDFCVDSIDGDEQTLEVHRSAPNGAALDSIFLSVTEMSSQKIVALSEAGDELNVTPLEGGFGGGFRLNEAKLGFFVSCQVTP